MDNRGKNSTSIEWLYGSNEYQYHRYIKIRIISILFYTKYHHEFYKYWKMLCNWWKWKNSLVFFKTSQTLATSVTMILIHSQVCVLCAKREWIDAINVISWFGCLDDVCLYKFWSTQKLRNRILDHFVDILNHAYM